MDYYQRSNAMARMAEILMRNGWEVHNYKSDTSDLMTDYYSPAYWGIDIGIATKGKYIFVCDGKGKSGIEIILNQDERNNYNDKINSLSRQQCDKIEKLQRLADRTTFDGEKLSALEKINRIKDNKSDVTVVEKIKKQLDFPVTNYAWFIWDTEDMCIIKKSVGMNEFGFHGFYETDFKSDGTVEMKNPSHIRFSSDASKVSWIEKAISRVVVINNFVANVSNLDNVERVYKYRDSKKGKQMHFIEKRHVDAEYLENNIGKVYIEYRTNMFVFDEIKVGYRNLTWYKFVKIKKDGDKVSKVGMSSSHSINVESIDNNVFYTGFIGTEYKWMPTTRTFEIENKSEDAVDAVDAEIDDFNIFINNELDGVEVKFNERPSVTMISKLKSLKFRWHPKKKIWYAKNINNRLDNITELLKNRIESYE